MRRISGSATRSSGSAALKPPRTLVLWGERGSGKSGVIGALRSEAAKTVGERWALDLEGAPPDTLEYVDTASLALRLRDVKETIVARPDRPTTLTVKRFAGTREQEVSHLAVLDPRGALADGGFDAGAREMIHALATADGIIWLLDVREALRPAARERLLRQIVAALESAGTTQLRVPVAIVMSRIDSLPAVEMRRALNGPEEMLRAQLGDAALGWLVAACPRLRCFAMSAAGTVRNAARPVGLSAVLDWFSSEWRRGERETELVRTRARRSARVARLRRRIPVAALAVAAAAVVVFAGGAAARRLTNRSSIWSASAGNVADPTLGSETAPVRRPADTHAFVAARKDTSHALSAPMPAASLAQVVATRDSGNVRGALELLDSFRLAASDTSWFAADSVLAALALDGTEAALRASPADTALLRLIERTTTAAIGRAHPGTFVLAPLSLARAGACITGKLDCPADRLREDLAWTLLFGTPQQQDGARRLRAAWLADSLGGGS